MTWFFVSLLPDGLYEVQILDEDGGGIASEQFGADCTALTIEGTEIPAAVIAAAKQRTVGHGEYVDAQGRLLDMYGQLRQAA